MYQKVISVSIWVFAILALLGAFLLVSWNTAASQSPTPPPPGMERITPAGELTPFEPTLTPTGTATPTDIVILPLPTATNTRRPRPTIEATPVRVGSNAHLPIARVP